MEQLHLAKKGETVFLSLGTNDAVGGALDVKAKVAAIVAEADKLGVKLVWIGPPCVRKDWERYSKQLDGILAAELADTSATYVSMQDDEFCSARLHAAEGVHFTMAGYTRMWQKAAAAVKFSTAVASVASVARRGARERQPTRRSKRRNHHHARNRHGAANGSDRDAGKDRGCAAMIRISKFSVGAAIKGVAVAALAFAEFRSAAPARAQAPAPVTVAFVGDSHGRRSMGRDVSSPWKRQMSGGKSPTGPQSQERDGADAA